MLTAVADYGYLRSTAFHPSHQLGLCRWCLSIFFCRQKLQPPPLHTPTATTPFSLTPKQTAPPTNPQNKPSQSPTLRPLNAHELPPRDATIAPSHDVESWPHRVVVGSHPAFRFRRAKLPFSA